MLGVPSRGAPYRTDRTGRTIPYLGLINQSTREGAIQLAPGQGSQSRRPAGYEGPNPTTLVVAQAYVSATARVDYVYRILFPPVVRGRLPPPTRGLAEWHPDGCAYLYLFR